MALTRPLNVQGLFAGTPDEVQYFLTCSLSNVIWSSLIGDQQVYRVNSLLSFIQNFLSENEPFAERVRFHVKEKGAHDRALLAKLADFQGIDRETQEILDRNSRIWSDYPLSFWARPMPAVFGFLEPEDQVVTYYLQTECDDP